MAQQVNDGELGELQKFVFALQQVSQYRPWWRSGRACLSAGAWLFFAATAMLVMLGYIELNYTTGGITGFTVLVAMLLGVTAFEGKK